MVMLSHPSRVRGLKPYADANRAAQINVAPLAGAWIETGHVQPANNYGKSRTPRGCVD